MSASFERTVWLRRLCLLLLLLLLLAAALGAVFLARGLGDLASPSGNEAAETALPSALAQPVPGSSPVADTGGLPQRQLGGRHVALGVELVFLA